MTDDPNPDPLHIIGIRLGAGAHDGGLIKGDTYTGSLTVTLAVGPWPLHRHQDGLPQRRARTTRRTTSAAVVRGHSGAGEPGRHKRRHAARQPLGRTDDDPVHRAEPGRQPGWPGTYWRDDVYISADGNFSATGPRGSASTSSPMPSRSSRARRTPPRSPRPAKGIGGNLFVYIHPDTTTTTTAAAARPCRPSGGRRTAAKTRACSITSAGGPSRTRRDNVYRAPIHVTYYEPDLAISGLQVPGPRPPGQTVDVTYTVTNQGTGTLARTSGRTGCSSRGTRRWTAMTCSWASPAAPPCGIGESYTGTVTVRLPDGIDGPFYVIVLTDSPAAPDGGTQSDIGFGNFGVRFEGWAQLRLPGRRAGRGRSLVRGRV